MELSKASRMKVQNAWLKIMRLAKVCLLRARCSAAVAVHVNAGF
jgi:hypothetical protein